ncbi:WLM-domain-containing protein [Guyanagaster necrorhizus]|uniref:WLM-domain-containing protein n=1 Tax=Guyanagaster necrorhizus TaxID=856835 RepID=A0A9P7VQN0_9AGAR|nr:WLM-domain-containing protein [Guyanagaster necrorhizus MCA 3950]KAG7445119.1 WLM-domain-containing protein [Guyanagaster necrorhizus MCA 3950]
MASAFSDIAVTVVFRGTPHHVNLLPESTLGDLQNQLEKATSVSPSLQKLLYKGKNIKQNRDGQETIASMGLRNGSKIQMLGTTSEELDGIQATESEQKRINQILQERALKPAYKVRSTGTMNSASLNYGFHQLLPLPHLRNPTSAHKLLRRLSDDPAIQHIMQQHQFSVGVLTELAPHEHPGLLGLNVNAGQQIKLRLRTDRYDGFRAYNEVRRVLCHELTHNVWGDHNNDFKELNSKLNREVAEFERARRDGTHSLSGLDSYDVYEPSPELEAEAHIHVLGGSGPFNRDEERRRHLSTEQELEDSCGTAGPSSLGP